LVFHDHCVKISKGSVIKTLNQCGKKTNHNDTFYTIITFYTKRTTDPGQATGKLYHLRLRVECTLFCNLQSHIGDRLV
jgi:hypothetical protein